MRFPKGHIPWIKGKGQNLTRLCIRCGNQFKVFPCKADRSYCSRVCYREHKEKYQSILDPLKAEEIKQKISKGNTGKKHEWLIERNKLEKYKRYGAANQSKRPEVRKKISESLKGAQHPQWKGGVTPIHALVRTSAKYRAWRTAVFERDNYTCQSCKDRNYEGRGGTLYLEAHHVKAFSIYPELRFEVSNGLTLCKSCHPRPGNKKYNLES